MKSNRSKRRGTKAGVALKAVYTELAIQNGVEPWTAWAWLRRSNRFIGFRIKRVNPRVLLVLGKPEKNPACPLWARAGEISWKTYLFAEAARLGIKPNSVNTIRSRARYAGLRRRIVNSNCVFVTP